MMKTHRRTSPRKPRRRSKGFGTERYQWLRNAEAGQHFGSQTVIVPLNQFLYRLFVFPLLDDKRRKAMPRVIDFLARWPSKSCIRLLRSAGQGRWRLDGIGYAEELRPRRQQLLWVLPVRSFEDRDARIWGRTADSEPVGVAAAKPTWEAA
jgi:hypothetical protein